MNIAKKTLSNVSPTYPHACAFCTFLGKLDGIDMYACDRDGVLIRRFGVDSSAYGALPLNTEFAAGSVYSLASTLAGVAKKQGKRYVPHAYVTRPSNVRVPLPGRVVGVGGYRNSSHYCSKGCEHCDGEGGHFVLPDSDQYAPG